MADYKNMFLTLYGSLIKIQKEIEEAQSMAEDIYLYSTEKSPQLKVVKKKKEEKKEQE